MPDFSSMPEIFVSNAELAPAVSREVKLGQEIWASHGMPHRHMAEPMCQGKATLRLAREIYGIADPEEKQSGLFVLRSHLHGQDSEQRLRTTTIIHEAKFGPGVPIDSSNSYNRSGEIGFVK